MTTSYREGGLKRRAVRQAKDKVRPQSGSTKDTKRWCRGVEGRMHAPLWVSYNDWKGTTRLPAEWRVLVCTVCRREFKYHVPSRRVMVPKT